MIPIITSNHFVLHFQFFLLSLCIIIQFYLRSSCICFLYFIFVLAIIFLFIPNIGINKNTGRKRKTMINEPKDLITIEELCSLLSIGRNTAYRLLNENKIKAFRIGKIWKIPKKSVEEFILTQSQLKK